MAGLDAFMNKFGPKSYGSQAYELGPPPSPKVGGLDQFISRFTGFTESYFFYDNTVELRFNVDEHKYYLVEELGNLTEQNGVTNTVHIINAAEMLVPWAAKVTVAKMLRLIPTENIEGILRIKPITFEEFTTIAMEAKSAHKDKLEEAGDIGHLAHKCLEDSIKSAIAHDPDKTVRQLINLPNDDRACNAAGAGKSWMDQHRVRWVETETKIYSRKHKYAGTMDGLAYVSSCGNKACCPHQFENRLSLIDWKSSNHLKIEYLFQTASYKGAKQEEFPDLKIEDIWILRLGKNEDEAGKFEPWHMGPEDFEVCYQGFLACLELTRLVAVVTERMKEQKKLIRQYRKEIREAEKALKREQEKLEKALKKAEEKKAREAEKERIKAEAKAKREADKAARAAEREAEKALKKTKKSGKVKADVELKEETCTSSENITDQKPDEESSPLPTSEPMPNEDSRLATTPPLENSTSKPTSPLQPTKTVTSQPKEQPETSSITLTVETKLPKRYQSVVFEEPDFQATTISLPGEK